MELLTPHFGLIFWTLIAFVIVFLILKKFAWAPILKALHEREAAIADSIASAEKIKAEMALMKSEHEQVLAEAKAERSRILKEAKDVRDRIVNEAKEQAKAEARKIVEEAQAAINNQKMAALIEVKNLVGNLVIELAEKVLRKEMSNKTEQETYIKKLAEEIRLN